MQVDDTEAAERIKQSRDAIEAIEPSDGAPSRTLTFHGWRLPDGSPVGDAGKSYVQAQLGMFPVQEFGVLVSGALNEFTQGDIGARIGDLFRGDVQMPVTMDSESVNKVVSENEALIMAFFKLMRMLPSFQLDVMCLSLGVPRREREWFKDCVQEPPHRGGLDVEAGFGILIYFVRQNARLIQDSVMGKARELVEVFQLEVLGRSKKTTSERSDDHPQPSPGTTPSSTSSVPIPASV